MNFSSITSIGNHVKQTSLTNELVMKTKTGTLGQKENATSFKTGQLIGREQALSPEVEAAKKVGAINGKLYFGETLTEEELLFLKANSPESYQKAVQVIEEREAYREELKEADSKEEVNAIGERKMSALGKDLKAAKGNLTAEMHAVTRINNITKEHTHFIASTRYQQLPDTYLEAMEKRKKKEPYEGEELPDLDKVEAQKVEVNKSAFEEGVMYDVGATKTVSTSVESTFLDTKL